MVNEPQVRAAVERIPQQSNDEIRIVRENAIRLDADKLVEACDVELKLRGFAALSEDQAILAYEQAARMNGKPLSDVILAAFTEVPLQDYEIMLLRTIYRLSGRPFQEIQKAYQKNKLSLDAGHIVCTRFGYFRHFVEQESDLISIFISKGQDKGFGTWALKKETIFVLKKLEVLGE